MRGESMNVKEFVIVFYLLFFGSQYMYSMNEDEKSIADREMARGRRAYAISNAHLGSHISVSPIRQRLANEKPELRHSITAVDSDEEVEVAATGQTMQAEEETNALFESADFEL